MSADGVDRMFIGKVIDELGHVSHLYGAAQAMLKQFTQAMGKWGRVVNIAGGPRKSPLQYSERQRQAVLDGVSESFANFQSGQVSSLRSLQHLARPA